VKLAVKGSGGSKFATAWEKMPASLKLARIKFREVRASEQTKDKFFI